MSHLIDTAEKSVAVIAACKAKHQRKDGIVFITSATAAKLGINADPNWDGRINSRLVTNQNFKLALGKIDGNTVMICEDTRLGVHYSTAEDMTQLFD
jgi:hypothetical protein